ncbi:acyl-CoA carboxylase subunit epsilon [Streptomyces sp. NPDC047315]|uniref:acyl-CoA carboxylase subunit epsilon n=1 Tax=Streptomyces sp. NPDC047315 TaxID=3155142 RepID=UPI0034094D89
MIKIVRGNPTPEELAAAVAVVRARAMEAGAGEGGASVPLGQERWSSPSRIARGTLPMPGPRAWAHTYWPI